MAVEQLQCPICGDVLHVEQQDRYAVCHYCERPLKITEGASGRPLAAIINIGAVKERKLHKLQQNYQETWEELVALLDSRSQLKKEQGQEEAQNASKVHLWVAGASAVITVLLLVIAAILEDRQIAFLAGAVFIIGRAGFFVLQQMVEIRLRDVARKYEPKIRAINKQIAAVESKLAGIEVELSSAEDAAEASS